MIGERTELESKKERSRIKLRRPEESRLKGVNEAARLIRFEESRLIRSQ